LVLGTSALAVAARRGGVGGPGVSGVPPIVPSAATATGNGGVAAAPTAAPTATPGTSEAASSYVATAPHILRSGGVETIALTLANGDRPATTRVAVALLKDGKTVASGEEWISGRGSVPLGVPNLAAGDYTLRVSGRGFADEGAVRVEAGTILFLESDKPIYKPGETVRLRVLSLNSALRPVAGQVTVEAADAKGIKIFRKIVAVDAWGMATLELPLSTESNLGVWKLRATTGTGAGAGSTQLDIRVERYVLPKYEVKVTLPKGWALVTETMVGTIGAQYSFGKPVKGEATIVALRYGGTWQEYARLTRPIDGTATFEIPAARYSAGSPGNGGAGAVRLDVTVREAATDYEEKSSTLVTIVAAPVAVRLIPESGSFKPGLPLGLLVVAAGPDGKAAEADVALTLNYQDADFKRLPSETRQVTTKSGVATLNVTPPAGAVVLSVASSFTARGASGTLNGTPLTLRASYSPTGAFLRVEQLTGGTLRVGEQARFRVTATKEAKSFYYEILSRGKVVYSDVARESEIVINLDPVMAPESRLVAYQILPDGEVAADWVGFKVEGALPQRVTLSVEREEVAPGGEVGVTVQTEGAARVGLAAVDRAVFILAENRLNLRAVFDEIERLYGTPQAEAHVEQPAPGGPVPLPAPVEPPGGAAAPRVAVALAAPTSTISPGAKEAFAGAGLLVLTNRKVPAGRALQVARTVDNGAVRQAAGAAAPAASSAPAAAAPAATQATAATEAGALAEPERVRQFFPETWVWSDLTTDPSGKATQRLTAPDSITTWNFRAVALSKEKGLGIGEATLRVFQPFFVTVDLPYAAIRGEEFPVRVALYNYDATAQEFTVELAAAGWFTSLDGRSRTVTVEPQAVGAASFTIRPTGLGVGKLQLAARGRTRADAIIKELIVEPEGVGRERIENLILAAGTPRTVALAAPESAIAGSPRVSVALTGSLLSQTIEGLDSLLQMPYGCGEQNMLLFAPDVYIARYLRETQQAKPEIAAKAELLMLTGYQRELTYRRVDGSYSAFGQRDKSGSLWLTAFVLKTFAQASDLIYIDEAVQRAARDWIRGVQQADGSFEQVGFVHHAAMMGGVQGKTALTAYVAIALREAGDDATSARAIGWLEGQLGGLADPYALAIVAYALGLAKSARAGAARDQLLRLARQTDGGLSWGDDPQPVPLATPTVGGAASPVVPRPNDRGRSAATETTAYAALALLAGGDTLNAGRAIRWLAGRRGAQGGFGSTQDTVVALQALTNASITSRTEIDATVTLVAGSFRKEVRITPENADVMQIIDLPGDGAALSLETRGNGQPVVQVVQRFNLPAAEVAATSAFALDVRYGAEEVATNDLLNVTATVRYTPPTPQPAGMVVLDLAVPTGFTPETSSLEALAKRTPKLKRWDIAGRKVLLYIEEMNPDEALTLAFQARALYPVRAQAVASQAYAYYRPEWRGESLGGKVVVRARG
jgi:CD109 antigen